MNIVLNLKQSQLQGVLEVLGRMGGTVDIVLNIKDGQSEKEISGITPRPSEWIEKQEEEKEAKEEGV
ncbi:hypothetical protein E3J48_02425 [Candidatus Aerophobetes bacterium]|uniref:Uncharacterized protein n=1 Tax=Aerophobetes bacterium TaxID=2030807 RepID=A0A523W8Y2_UNCAE|nr:MAG: hypothetical protein E3J48_02425 [Candidatus Aerophobetes bacterium]